MNNQVKNAIISDVESALYGASGRLASSAKNGNTQFSQTINDALRPVLLSSIQRHVGQHAEAFLSDFNASLNIETLNSNNTDAFGTMGKIIGAMGEKSGTFKIGGLAAFAIPVVGPILAPIIAFLPEILNLLSGLFGGGNRQDDAIEGKIRNEVIPQIIQDVGNRVAEILADFERDFITEIEERFQEMLTTADEALSIAKEKKAQNEAEFQNWINGIDADLNEIKQIQEDIRL